MFHRLLGLTIVILACSMAPVSASADESVAALDFSQGFGTWKNEGAELAQSPDGQRYAHMEQTGDSMLRLHSPPINVAGQKFVEIRFQYRTSVTHSAPHVGTWAYIAFYERGKIVGSEAIICPPAASWMKQVRRFAIPASADRLQAQFRLQHAKGTADWGDISIRFVNSPEVAATDDEQAETASLREVTRFELKDTPSGWVMDNGRVQLSDANAQSADDKYPIHSFILPDEYCENEQYVYEAAIEFTADWNSIAGNIDEMQPNGLFQLGRNFQGVKPNSAGATIWTNAYLARITSSTMSAKADTRQLIKVEQGKTYTAKVRFSADGITSYWNGRRISFSHATMPQKFLWPKNKPFFVGGEDIGTAPLQGAIKSFTLRVLTPKVQVGWVGGRGWGYLIGDVPHVAGLQFPEGNGLVCASTFSITDMGGKVVAEGLSPTSRTAAIHTLSLPVLPNGWYLLRAQVKMGDATAETSSPFVCLPSAPLREPVAQSPFGITEEINFIRIGKYDPDLTEALFSRAALMGVRWYRVWLRWDDVQTAKGEYNWAGLDDVVNTAARHGIELYVCLLGGGHAWQSGSRKAPWQMMGTAYYKPADMEAWADYLTALATRYRGRVKHYQIWNEADASTGFFPFDTAQYVELLEISAKTLRAVDSSNVIGLSGFCGAFVPHRLNRTAHDDDDKAWGLAEFYGCQPQSSYDILDYHFYSLNEPGQSWDNRVRDVRQVRAYADSHGDAGKPIWNSETSFLTGEAGKEGAWKNVQLLSEAQQAARLVQWYAQSLAVGIQRNFWFRMRGEFGVTDGGFDPKPAFAAHAVLVQRLHGLRYVAAADLGANLRAYSFSGEGRFLTILWATGGKELVSIEAKDTAGTWRAMDMMGNALKPGDTGIQGILVGEDPIYLESSGPLRIASVLEAKVVGTPVIGRPVTIQFTVRNPAAVDTVCSVVAAVGRGNTLRTSFTIPAKSIQEQQLLVPEGSGILRLDAALNGGITQNVLIERSISSRLSVELAEGRKASTAMNKAEQIKIGAETLDPQGRKLTEGRWGGVNDLSAAITLERSGRTVRFAVDVRDDHVVPAAKDAGTYDGDAVEVFLDLREQAGNDPASVFQIVCGPDGRVDAVGKRMPPGFSSRATRIAIGYRVEGQFDLPAALAESFGFDVAVDDADVPGGRKVQMVWAGTNENYRNPDLLAMVLLRP
ncbi:MAG: sugar-binding protein [Phycisphaeraceae bacterium]